MENRCTILGNNNNKNNNKRRTYWIKKKDNKNDYKNGLNGMRNIYCFSCKNNKKKRSGFLITAVSISSKMDCSYF